MDITLDAKTAYTSIGYEGKSVTVELSDVSESEILDQFKISDIISHFGKSELLDEIGSNEAKDHFGLIDDPGEE